MHLVITLFFALFLSSVSQAIYVPDNSEQILFRCENSVMKLQVIRTFEGQHIIKTTDESQVITEELVTESKIRSTYLFTSKNMILKMDQQASGNFLATFTAIRNQRQERKSWMRCQLIYSIMSHKI